MTRRLKLLCVSSVFIITAWVLWLIGTGYFDGLQGTQHSDGLADLFGVLTWLLASYISATLGLAFLAVALIARERTNLSP